MIESGRLYRSKLKEDVPLGVQPYAIFFWRAKPEASGHGGVKDLYANSAPSTSTQLMYPVGDPHALIGGVDVS